MLRARRYDCYAIVHHIGALGAGHYVASVRDKDGDETSANKLGNWKTYNDQYVTEVSDPNDLIDSSAYILFYIRKDIKRFVQSNSDADIINKLWRVNEKGEDVLEEMEKMLKTRDSGRCVVS